MGDWLILTRLGYFILVLYTHIINMHIYTYTCRIHFDAIIKTSEDFFKKIYLSLYLKGFEKGYSRFYSKRELETEQNCHILTPTLMAISVSFPFSWCCSTGGLGAHSAGCWLSLPHLVTNGSGLQTNWLPVFTELYNSSIAHSISPHNWPSGCVTSAVLGMACLIVIERK